MTTPRQRKRMGRRLFLARAAAAGWAVQIVPRRVLGGPGRTSPAHELTRAVIGVGGMGRGHLRFDGARTVAVCDADEKHLAEALKLAPDARGYRDFREVLARPDVDVVHIATPPHWHALMSIAAVEAGKDVWCEKPMTHTIAEGAAVREAVRRRGRIFRINTWFRFTGAFYGFGAPVAAIKKIVDAGWLGWPLRVTIGAVTGFSWKFDWGGLRDAKPEPVPPELDYDMWLGPAPWKPYHPHRVHATFRGYWDYDGGGLGDMGQHYLDPVQYILGKDDTGPVEAEADAPPQHPDAAGSFRRIWLRYADGCEIVLDGEPEAGRRVPFIEGPNGRLFRHLESDIPDLRRRLAGLPDPPAQPINFYECVRSRQPFALNERNAHRSCTLVNLAILAWRLGRPVRWDPDAERLVGSDLAAERLAAPVMRAPWTL